MSLKRIFFTLLSLTLIFYSCSRTSKSAASKEVEQEITFNIEKDPATLDGRKSTLLRDFNIIRTFNEGLYRIDQEKNLAPAIAESCNILSDKKTYVIKLKKTLWSNGIPLTAYDFIYAWKSALDKNFPSPTVSLLYPLKNAEAIRDGTLSPNMLGVHAQGAYTLVIELERETPFFLELLSLPLYFPVNEAACADSPEWRDKPEGYICNGPFKIVSYKSKNEIVAVKNNRYWDASAVKLKKLNMIIVDKDTAFNMYQNKELQLIGAPYSHIPPDALNDLTEKNLLKRDPILRTHIIRVNTTNKFLENTDFRRALGLAVNRKSIVEYVLSGGAQIATGLIPISMRLRNDPYFKDGDTDTAKLHLENALKALKMKKEDLPTLTLTYCGSGNNHKIAATLQDSWRKTLGIAIELEPLEQKVYLDRIAKGDYQLVSGAWAADFKDPINFLEVFKSKNSASNHTGWESLDYLAAIEDSYSCTNKKDRIKKLKLSEQILMDQMPIIPVYHYHMLRLQDSKLKDVVTAETGILDLKWAYLEE